MLTNNKILVAGGGTAGWLTACYLARSLNVKAPGAAQIVVVESPEIGIIGVGEGTFPSIRTTLQSLGIDEARFLRESSATFKQGIRFEQWVHAPQQQREHYLHPFEFPHRIEGDEMLPYWLLGDAGEVPFADAVTIQKKVADAAGAQAGPGPGLPSAAQLRLPLRCCPLRRAVDGSRQGTRGAAYRRHDRVGATG
jgi:tryptophan halogenase